MTLYEDLELTPSCSFDDIKQQYRTLAGRHHPDKGGDEEKFKRIKNAYEILSDPVRRKQYDEGKSTDIPIDKRQDAINQLSYIFASIISTFDPASGSNLVELIKAELLKNTMLIIADRSRFEDAISKLEITSNKIRTKNHSDENILSTFIDTQIGYRKIDIETCNYRISVLELSSTIVDNYLYGYEELPVFLDQVISTD